MTLRYALIGAGMMGQEHLRNIALLDGVRVTAIAEPDAGMAAEAMAMAGPQARHYPDYRTLLGIGAFDAVVIATPNDTHRSVLLDAITLGKPILCEKPLCTTVEDCANVERAADAAGVPIWVAMEYRYMPPIARLLDLNRERIAGTPHMVTIREHRFPFLPKVGQWNRFNARTGGTFVEKCCHFFDLMYLITGAEPVRVYASAGQAANHLDERHDGQVPDILDHGFVIVDFDNGTRAMLDLCMFAEGSHYQEEIAIVGDKAKVEAFVPGPGRFLPDGHEGTGEIVISPRATKRPTRETVPVDPRLLEAGDHNGATFYQHERFRRVVLGHATPDVTLTDGARAVRVGSAAEESARTGLPVVFEPNDEPVRAPATA